MTEKQMAYFSDLMNMAMSCMDAAVEANGAVYNAKDQMVWMRVRNDGKCKENRGFAFNFSALRNDMQGYLRTIPVEPKSIDLLRDWRWIDGFVATIDAKSYFYNAE